MNRCLFFKDIIVDEIPQLDLLDSSLPEFKIVREPAGYYRVNQADLGNPDLIAYKVYQTERFWWLICLANGIMDVKNDLEVGQLLTIPNILDINDFYKKRKRR